MMEKRGTDRGWMLRLASMLLAVLLILGLIEPLGVGMPVSATDAPAAENIYVYNSNSTGWSNMVPSVVYILTNGTDSEAVYRVYADYGEGRELLGSGQQNGTEGFCAVTLSEILDQNQTLYVTRTVGTDESASVTVNAGGRSTPTISLNMNEINSTRIPVSNESEVSNFRGTPIMRQGRLSNRTLTKGKYYQVEVLLSGFTAVDAVMIPLRYDTNYLKPATGVSGSGYNYLQPMSDANFNAAKDGITFAVPYASGYREGKTYGVFPGMHFTSWVDSKKNAGSFSLPTEGGEYQSLNTTTGLYKLQASVKNPAPFGSNSTTQFVRFYFQATQTVTLDSEPVWFASAADCPEDAKDSDALRLTYYDPASPNGIQATLSGANVMTPPPVLKSVDVLAAPDGVDETLVTLSASDVPSLPDSYFNAVRLASGTTQLKADEVRIYNYTNYSASGDGIGTLDSSTYDKLEIDSSVAIRANDYVRVYVYDGTAYQQIGEGQARGDRKVSIDLGMGNLRPEGGVVYVSVVRGSQESPKVQVPYVKEVSRDITFQICRSGWAEDHAIVDYKRNPEILNDVKLGEQIQIRIYFNNIYELMSYGFAIHFDPRFVKVANIQYEAMGSGTVLEESYKNGDSCFAPGKDLTNVTLTEQIIYQAAQRADETEIQELIDELGIDRDTFDQIAADVEVKYDVGVTAGTGELPWKGGLLFTGERGDNSGLPYVDNGKGCVQFLSASLVKPSNMEREGGYHFLSVNFVATANAGYSGAPDFRLATDVDDAYCPVLPRGKQVVLMGGADNLGITEYWEVAPMGDHVEMTLADGNSNDVTNPTALYLYEGSAFRDPGFSVIQASGASVPLSDVKRFYVDADDQDAVQNPHHYGTMLDTYEKDEVLDIFHVKDGEYSAHYIMYYEYGPHEGTSDPLTRDIYIIYRKGDVNRDGEINLFDEQALADHTSGYMELDLGDELYRSKTVDVNQDGEVDDWDREQLLRRSLGYGEFIQDYVMPVQ